MKNLAVKSINELKKKYSFQEKGICKVDEKPCKAIYFGRWSEASKCFCYTTLLWWNGAWRTPCTSFGMGYHGKMISIRSQIN